MQSGLTLVALISMKPLSRIDRQKTYILASVSVLFAFGIAWLINQNEIMFVLSDFLSRWWPMDKLLSEGRNIYDLQNGAEVAEFAGLGAGPLWNNFFYPAHYLVVLLPFALIPYRLAHFLWTALGLLAFFGGTWLVIREVNWPKTLNRATLFMVMATLFVPTLQHTLWSQFNTVGLLAFALVLWAIGKGHLWQAGVWAAFMTMKPQASLFPLAALLIWSLSVKKRRVFVLGFGAAMVVLLLIAEIFQPGWMLDFLQSLGVYSESAESALSSVVDWFWNPNQIMALIVALGWLLLVWRWRRVEAVSAHFKLLMAFSFAVNWLIVPFLGYLHTIAAPVAVLLLMSGLQELKPQIYPQALRWLIGIYIFGWLGFVYGTFAEGRYYTDLTVAIAFSMGIPLTIAVFSLVQLLVRRE
jgi:hypothetical protein